MAMISVFNVIITKNVQKIKKFRLRIRYGGRPLSGNKEFDANLLRKPDLRVDEASG